MKNVIKSLTVAVALSAFVAGPASAMVTQSDVNNAISSAIGTGSNVFASVNGDTLTLTGYFADAGVKGQALQAALAKGEFELIDHTSVSN